MNGWANGEKTFYIYRHIRHDKNEPFYIGKGAGYAPKKDGGIVFYYTFFKRAFDNIKRNVIWKGIVSKTEYDIDIIFETKDKNIIDDKEKEFIKLYGKIIDKTGSLSNLTDGGDGISEHGEAFYRSVKDRKENGVYKKIGDNNSRPIYIYSLDGQFLNKIRSKRDLVKLSGGDISTIFDSIRLKRSYKGYFLSNTYSKEGIDISKYRVSSTKGMNILQLNDKNEIVNVFASKTEAANHVGAKSISSIDIADRNGVKRFGYFWVSVPNITIFNNGNYNL